MFEDITSALILSLSLSVMFAAGLDIDARELFRTLSGKKPLVTGLLLNLVLCPLIALGWVTVFNVSGSAAVGILLCGIGAGGSTGLLFCFHSRANMSYGFSLFLLINLLSIVIVPPLFIWVAEGYQHNNPVQLIAAAVQSIISYQILPFIVGVVVRKASLTIAATIYPLAKRIADLSMIVLFMGFFVTRWELILDLGLVSIMTIWLVILTGVVASLVTRSPEHGDGRALLFVVVVRNLTLALLLNDRVLQDNLVTVTILSYGVFMYLTCGFLLLVLHKKFPVTRVA